MDIVVDASMHFILNYIKRVILEKKMVTFTKKFNYISRSGCIWCREAAFICNFTVCLSNRIATIQNDC